MLLSALPFCQFGNIGYSVFTLVSIFYAPFIGFSNELFFFLFCYVTIPSKTPFILSLFTPLFGKYDLTLYYLNAFRCKRTHSQKIWKTSLLLCSFFNFVTFFDIVVSSLFFFAGIVCFVCCCCFVRTVSGHSPRVNVLRSKNQTLQKRDRLALASWTAVFFFCFLV